MLISISYTIPYHIMLIYPILLSIYQYHITSYTIPYQYPIITILYHIISISYLIPYHIISISYYHYTTLYYTTHHITSSHTLLYTLMFYVLCPIHISYLLPMSYTIPTSFMHYTIPHHANILIIITHPLYGICYSHGPSLQIGPKLRVLGSFRVLDQCLGIAPKSADRTQA